MDRSAIQIHFCDVCGVSVPLADVEVGRALSADGRILCPSCRAARAPERALVPRAIWLALVALLLGSLFALAV
jgi:hypothetical protein